MYGLIGEKLGHSYSKGIHEQLADYTYNLIELTKEQLHEFLCEKKFHAVNVTIPYKQIVIPYLDELDVFASKIGAVNVIVNKEGYLKGYNTDYYGFRYMLDYHKIAICNRKVVVLGVGGASKAVRAVLADMQASDIIFVHPKGKDGITYEECYEKHCDADVIVNTTPVGMYPNNDHSPIELPKFTQLESVVDVVYNPLKTKLIVEAELMGLKVCGGLMMLVAQAKEAVEIFTGKKICDSVIERITKELEKEKRNLVLIGMPSCGKSTIGKLLAEQLHCPFIDMDEEIVKKAGKSIPDIFKEDGEPYFRDLETQVAKEVSKNTSVVISCGGGVVKKVENILSLKQNGILLYIKRDIDKLLSDNSRPLSSSKEAIFKLYEERYILYEKYSDRMIENNGTIIEVVRRIFE